MRVITIVFMLLGAMAIVLCACAYSGLGGSETTVQNSGFDDERFLLLLFPVGEETFLERAVIATIAEYQKDVIEVYVDGAGVTMPKSGLASVPPENHGVFVERLNQELSVWGEETDWSNIEYAFAPSEAGGRAVVRIKDKEGTTIQYTYLVEESSIRPLEVKTEVNVAANLAR